MAHGQATLVTERTQTGPAHTNWARADYVDMAVGQSITRNECSITLRRVEGDQCEVVVDGTTHVLTMARRGLPETMAGARLFVADTRPVAELTDDRPIHGLMQHDALLCISQAERPLIDPERFTFPVSREDGFEWRMAEASHMFAYLGHVPSGRYSPLRTGREFRSHEGVDIDMHEARGKRIHRIVAVEDATVEWVHHNEIDPNQACVLLRSRHEPDIAYVNQHLYWPAVQVSAGDTLRRGDTLGYIWGDTVWGHLHFAVVHAPTTPSFEYRYRNLLNCFPQLYALYHGDCDERPSVFTEADLRFGLSKDHCGNRHKHFAYTDLLGYGWCLGSWCPARAVERGAIVRRTLHPGTAAQARNPHPYFDFAIRVQPQRTYMVQAEVGNAYGSSWQAVQINGHEAGTFDLRDGGTLWTGRHSVEDDNGFVTVRVHVRDEERAGLRRVRLSPV